MSLSGHWLIGMRDTIMDYSAWVGGFLLGAWGVMKLYLGTFGDKYATKVEVNQRFKEIEVKLDRNHELINTNLNQMKDLLITSLARKDK